MLYELTFKLHTITNAEENPSSLSNKKQKKTKIIEYIKFLNKRLNERETALDKTLQGLADADFLLSNQVKQSIT